MQISDLINKLTEQFKSKTQYQKFIRDIEQKFDIKSYRFQLMSQFMARKTYNQLRQKYLQNQLTINQTSWYQNQRKIFVWVLLAYQKLLADDNKQMSQQNWEQLSQCFFKKSILFLKYQYNAILKRKKRNPWTKQQDQILKSCQQAIENNNWNQIAKQIFFKTHGNYFKCPKQIRQRWQNHLNTNIKKQSFSQEQDHIILNFVLKQGKRWAQIVEKLQYTRTEHMIKNRYKSLISKHQSEQKSFQNEQQIIKELLNLKNLKDQKKQINQSQSQRQIKDKIDEQLPPQIKFYSKKCVYGCIQRGQNGQFGDQKLSVSSGTPYIFESRSPACISFNSSFLGNSYSLYNSRELTPSNDNGQNFHLQSQTWKTMIKKSHVYESANQEVTDKLFGVRSDSFHRLSHQYNDIQSGSSLSNLSNKSFNQEIDKLQNFLINKNEKKLPQNTYFSNQFQDQSQKNIDKNIFNKKFS